MSSPLEQYLTELGDTSKPLLTSKLVNLSDLSPEEKDILMKVWLDIDVERRRQIVSRLAALLEDNLELDFDEIFHICLGDTDSQVRAQAAEGLYNSEERSLIEPLINLLLQDEEYTVRAAAAGALGKFAMLAELGKLTETDTYKVEEALLSAFDTENEHTLVRCKALEAVSPLGRPHIEEMIREAYYSDELEFQTSALYAMGRNCNPGWLPLLLKELRSPDSQLRFEAVRACAEIEAEEAAPHLLELTRDIDVEVMTSAIEALGRIGGDLAQDVLKNCLKSPDEVVREAARDALDEIAFWDDPSRF